MTKPTEKRALTAEEILLNEMRIPGSFEDHNDPNDLPLEIQKNLDNLGPVDTAAEVKEHHLDKGRDNDKDNDNDNMIKPR